MMISKVAKQHAYILLLVAVVLTPVAGFDLNNSMDLRALWCQIIMFQYIK